MEIGQKVYLIKQMFGCSEEIVEGKIVKILKTVVYVSHTRMNGSTAEIKFDKQLKYKINSYDFGTSFLLFLSESDLNEYVETRDYRRGLVKKIRIHVNNCSKYDTKTLEKIVELLEE